MFKKILSLIAAAVLVTTMASGVFATDINVPSANDKLIEFYESQKVGDIVLLDNGFNRIWERTLVIDEETPENSYVDTQYEKINKSRSYTRELSASQSHTYNYPPKIATGTIYAIFFYDGSIVFVEESRYTLSDPALTFGGISESTNPITGTLSCTLNFSAVTGLTPHYYDPTVKCGKNGV